MNIKLRQYIILSSVLLITLIFGFQHAAQADSGIIPNTLNNEIIDNGSIKIMTLNLHDGKDGNGMENSAKTLKLLQSENPDVIALQEVEPRELRVFKNAGYTVVSGMNYNLLAYHFGNAILTRHRVIYSRHHYLPGNLEQRGLNEAAIDSGGRVFTVLNTHLGLRDWERRQQFHAIRRIIGYLRGPILLMGDFNVESSDGLFADFGGNFREIGSVKPLTASFPSSHPQERLDQIWATQDWDVAGARTVPWSGSDHLPVEAELILADPSANPLIKMDIPEDPPENNPLLPAIGRTPLETSVCFTPVSQSSQFDGALTVPMGNFASISGETDGTLSTAKLSCRLAVLDLRDYFSHWKIHGKAQFTVAVAADTEGETRFAFEQYYHWNNRYGTTITAFSLPYGIKWRVEQYGAVSEKLGWSVGMDTDQNLTGAVAFIPDHHQVYQVVRDQCPGGSSQWKLVWKYHGGG